MEINNAKLKLIKNYSSGQIDLKNQYLKYNTEKLESYLMKIFKVLLFTIDNSEDSEDLMIM